MAYSSPVLVVDDDPIYLEVATAAITSLGISSVTTACDGEEAVLKLKGATSPFGLVFLDLNMPIMDGMAFLRAVSELKFDGFIVISSGESNAVVKTAQKLGCMLGLKLVGPIRKPINLVDMAKVLEQCVVADNQWRSGQKAFDLNSVTNDMITPYYQPQYFASDGRLRGAEVLARIITPDGSVIAPNRFFDHISHTPQAYEVAISTARRVFADLSTWQFARHHCQVAINLDASVLEKDIALELKALCDEFGVAPASVSVELTETALPSDITKLTETICRLRMFGFGLSLDDFGTGTSNFDLLQTLPFTELKIDMSIIQSMVDDPVALDFFKMIVRAADSLSLNSVAEGVETEDQFAIVRDHDVDVVQGYLFAKALPATEFEEQLWEITPQTEAV